MECVVFHRIDSMVVPTLQFAVMGMDLAPVGYFVTNTLQQNITAHPCLKGSCTNSGPPTSCSSNLQATTFFRSPQMVFSSAF